MSPYTQEISRARKACFLFLLDQSYSMEEPLGNSAEPQMRRTVDGLQRLAAKHDHPGQRRQGIKDWMDIGVFGYRTDNQGNPIMESALQGPLAGRELNSIAEIGANPLSDRYGMQQLPDEETGEMIQVPAEMPVWVDPRAEGGTPMCNMLHHGYEILENWIKDHSAEFSADRDQHHRRRIAGRRPDSLRRRDQKPGDGRRQRAVVQLPSFHDGRRSVHVSGQQRDSARRAGPRAVQHVERAARHDLQPGGGRRFRIAAECTAWRSTPTWSC